MCSLLEIKLMGFVFFKVIILDKSFLMQAPHPHTLLPGLKGIPLAPSVLPGSLQQEKGQQPNESNTKPA